jgi:hypothetical protein
MEAANPVSQSALTIKEVIGQVHGKRCLLPVPKEGELISSPEQVMRLFDLLMQERSIGQFIFWSVGRDRVDDYHFCDFSEDGEEGLEVVAPKPCIAGQDNVAVVIDGKRRLASLCVGLLGLHNGSVPTGSEITDDFLRNRKLYLNLACKASQPEKSYDFRFLTDSEASAQGEKMHWFEVGKVLKFRGPDEIDEYVSEQGLEKNEFAKECLLRLQRVIDDKRSVSCFVEKDEEVGKVFLMFL